MRLASPVGGIGSVAQWLERPAHNRLVVRSSRNGFIKPNLVCRYQRPRLGFYLFSQCFYDLKHKSGQAPTNLLYRGDGLITTLLSCSRAWKQKIALRYRTQPVGFVMILLLLLYCVFPYLHLLIDSLQTTKLLSGYMSRIETPTNEASAGVYKSTRREKRPQTISVGDLASMGADCTATV